MSSCDDVQTADIDTQSMMLTVVQVSYGDCLTEIDPVAPLLKCCSWCTACGRRLRDCCCVLCDRLFGTCLLILPSAYRQNCSYVFNQRPVNVTFRPHAPLDTAYYACIVRFWTRPWTTATLPHSESSVDSRHVRPGDRFRAC